MTTAKPRGLTEYQECSDLARWLDRRGVLFTHVPMGGRRDPKEAARLKAIGTKAGVPDFLIFSLPPGTPYGAGVPVDVHGEPVPLPPRGVAIEMKKARGGRVEPAQERWLEALRKVGWEAFVAHGAKDAIARLEGLGY